MTPFNTPTAPLYSPPLPQLSIRLAKRRHYLDNSINKVVVEILSARGGLECIALCPNGQLYITSFLEGSILKLDKNGSLSKLITGLNSPTGIAIGPDNHLYICCHNSSQILIYHTDGSIEEYPLEGLNKPQSLAFGPDGKLYIATDANKILKVNDDATLSEFAYSGGLNEPFHITFGPDSRLYVSSFFSDQILVAPVGGGELRVFASDIRLQNPRGIAFNDKGELLVSSSWNNLIIKFDTQGQLINIAVSETLDLPTGLAFDSVTKLLYVVSAETNQILQL